MSKLNFVLLKMMRWSGWLLLPVVILFLLTGYIMTGRYEFGKLLDEKSALMFHRMLHLPLIVLVLAHCLPGGVSCLSAMGLDQTSRRNVA